MDKLKKFYKKKNKKIIKTKVNNQSLAINISILDLF